MPTKLKVDWSLAEAMFKEGFGLKQIAKRTGQDTVKTMPRLGCVHRHLVM